MTHGPMQTKPLPEIDNADLKAARHFLTGDADGSRGRSPRPIPSATRGAVPVRNGIARARIRSAPKPDA